MSYDKFRFYLKTLKVYARYQLGYAIPFLVMLRINQKCNLTCSFCRLWRLKEAKEMNTKILLELIDDLARIGVPYLNITGGEPLMRDDLEIIGKHAAKQGLFTTINTNGTFLTKTKAALIANCFDIIKVSLDGFEMTHDRIRGIDGTYRKVHKGLKNLLAVPNRKAKVMIHFVANSDNIQEMPKFVSYFSKIVDAITIMPQFDMSSNTVYQSEAFFRYWKQVDKDYILQESNDILVKPSFKIGKNYCDASKLYYSVWPNGDVICCPNRVWKLGNLKHESFHDIWKNSLTEAQKKKISLCKGCFCRSSVEVSMIMRKNPMQLLFNAPGLIRKFRF
jgi:MoaA/NifB/PqqE/SkfB family radical SAM enzyme